MAISIYNIKKWYLMLTGKSILHVNQDIGKNFSITEIKGYYNNLTEKVTRAPELLTSDALPMTAIESGEQIEFPVAIFQYGLGAYDLYLQTGEEKYKIKFFQCCQWALNHQEASGAWLNFINIYPEHPYGAMCQGEGASLLLRAYHEINEKRYFESAERAINFMLTPVDQGGTLLIENSDYILLEFTHKAPVLNGWIFALFGLYDMLLSCKNEQYKRMYDDILKTLIRFMPKYDNGYWSLYNTEGAIASPFYHNLHIAQMQALGQMTTEDIFKEYQTRWEKDRKSRVKRIRAFAKKVMQKIFEK